MQYHCSMYMQECYNMPHAASCSNASSQGKTEYLEQGSGNGYALALAA